MKYICRECHEDYEQLENCCILCTPFLTPELCVYNSKFEALWRKEEENKKEKTND